MSTDTTGQAPTIMEEMVDAVAKVLFAEQARRINPTRPLSWDQLFLEVTRDRYRDLARHALTAALDGRAVVNVPSKFLVVDRPERDAVDDDGNDVWAIPGEHGEDDLIVAPGRGRVLVGSTLDELTPDMARRRAAAYVAAADRAEQLAGEVAGDAG